MARSIIWSENAEHQLQEILMYWKNRNKSNVYPLKLRRAFLGTVKILTAQPYLGVLIKSPAIYQKLVKDYLIIYEVKPEILFILALFDTRQDPAKLTTLAT